MSQFVFISKYLCKGLIHTFLMNRISGTLFKTKPLDLKRKNESLLILAPIRQTQKITDQ